jgi:cytoskeletal protein CcmA (bactofilin family)
MSFWNKVEKGSEPLPAPAQAPRSAPPRPDPAPPPASAERVAEAIPPPAPQREPAPAARADHLRLGRGVRLEGKLTFSGTVRIDATFQGSIVTDGVLVVGAEAKVDADISCGSIVVEGAVNGNVVARESVELLSTATVRGDLEAPALAIERGAVFDGASRRGASAASGAARREEPAAAGAPSVH